MEVVQ